MPEPEGGGREAESSMAVGLGRGPPSGGDNQWAAGWELSRWVWATEETLRHLGSAGGGRG